MSNSLLSEGVAALSRFVVGSETLEETLEKVCDLTKQTIAGTAFVGLTLMVEGRPRTAVFTDPTSPEVDQAQYDSGEGPCLDAFRKGEVFIIRSMTEDGPWPEFRRVAGAKGIRSTLSLPLVAGDTTIGAMNLYSCDEAAYAPSDAEAAEPFVTQASIALANASNYWETHSLTEHLQEAMKSRAVIEQAKGMLMAAQKCDAEAAFEMLVKASQRENIKLRQVAERIVEGAVQRAAQNTEPTAPVK